MSIKNGTAVVEGPLESVVLRFRGIWQERKLSKRTKYVGARWRSRRTQCHIQCRGTEALSRVSVLRDVVHPARGGNKRLKNALFLSAFAALHDPESRAYYDRKRAQAKKHNAALVCLARRRVDVMYAMLRDGTYYQAKTSTAA